MPELPEVETIVRDLNKKVLGQKIKDIWSDAAKLRVERLKSKVIGEEILDVKRRGKNILFYLSGGKILLIHQKMTGHLLYGKWEIKGVGGNVKSLLRGSLDEKVNNYIHLIFYLESGWQMALSDLRKFAKAAVFDARKAEDIEEIKKLGPDALEIKFSEFAERVLAKKLEIKKVLMDQGVIAGIGNIYSDDILWQAKIYPSRKSRALSEEELKKLFEAMGNILAKAVKERGTSISDFRDLAGEKGGYGNIRLVYRREGEPCQRCGTKIKRLKIGGRSSCYCPQCQEE